MLNPFVISEINILSIHDTTMLEGLTSLYSEIHQCHKCPNMNREKAFRNTDAVAREMDVFIISEALAPNQLRRSGVNFFQVDGVIGNTGKQLEKFLNLFERTVFPPREITTSSDSIIEKRSDRMVSVYNTEIAQCFPGRKDNNQIRNPTKSEMRNCAEMCFIERELEIIRPKLVILMGKKSWSSFYEIILEKTLPQDNLSNRIEEICQQSEIPTECIGDYEFKCLPIQHASGANPRFSQMIKNDTLVRLIKEVLDA